MNTKSLNHSNHSIFKYIQATTMRSLIFLSLIFPISAIIGGMRASNFPVAKSTVLIDNGFHAEIRFCSGVVITRRYILTLGQYCCLRQLSECQVMIGSGKSFEGGEIIRPVTATTFGNQGEEDTFALVVVKLQRPIAFQFYVPVTLPEVGDEQFELFTAIGWGNTVPNQRSELTDHLHSAEMPRLELDVCRKGAYKELFAKEPAKYAYAACYGYTDAKSVKKATLFDHGGPLLHVVLGRLEGLISTNNEVCLQLNESQPNPVIALDMNRPQVINNVLKGIYDLEKQTLPSKMQFSK